MNLFCLAAIAEQLSQDPLHMHVRCHASPIPIRLIAIILSLIVSASVVLAQEQTLSIQLTKKEPQGSINRLLLGSQYNYFSAPTKQLIRNDKVLESWSQLPVTVLRYPGGTWADHYVWDNPERSYYAVGNARTIITPEEFIESCRAIGAEPIFQVNTNVLNGDGSFINPGKIEDIRKGADRAARWVREANKRKKWNVKYWEIGNEVWIWLKPEEYALYVVEYAKAMRAVDPDIKIIACGLAGKEGPFNPSWLKFSDDPSWQPRKGIVNESSTWNQALLDHATGSFDYIAPHLYIESGDDAQMLAIDRYQRTNVKISANENLPGQIRWAEKMGPSIKVALTEWGCNFRQSVPVRRTINKPEPLYFYSLGNGLNTAYLFGKILEAGSTLDIAVLHSLDDIQTLWYWPKNELTKGEPLLHPIYLAMKLWGHHIGKTPLQVQTNSPIPTISSTDGNYPAAFAYASEDDVNIYVVVLNLDPLLSHRYILSPYGDIAQSTAQATWLIGKALDSQNFASWNAAAPQEVALIQKNIVTEASGWHLEMPAHSMVGLKIPKTPKQ